MQSIAECKTKELFCIANGKRLYLFLLSDTISDTLVLMESFHKTSVIVSAYQFVHNHVATCLYVHM